VVAVGQLKLGGVYIGVAVNPQEAEAVVLYPVSVTWIVKVKGDEVTGVPVMAPVIALSERPAAVNAVKFEVIAKVYIWLPPLATALDE
jgi:hypothetical protein